MRGKVAKQIRKKTKTRAIYQNVKKLYKNSDTIIKKQNLLK